MFEGEREEVVEEVESRELSDGESRRESAESRRSEGEQKIIHFDEGDPEDPNNCKFNVLEME